MRILAHALELSAPGWVRVLEKEGVISPVIADRADRATPATEA